MILLPLIAGVHVVCGSRLFGRTAYLSEDVTMPSLQWRKPKNKTRTLYTCQNVTIPSIPEIEDFTTKLSDLHAGNHSGKLIMTNREVIVLQTSFRLAMMAYGRNSGKSLLFRGIRLKNSDEVSMIEVQFKSSRHRRGNMDDTGHVVAYLIKVEGGVGVVLSYKGSTNTADWKANFKTFSTKMFPDLPGKEDVKVHKGFLKHKERLDKRMSEAEMLPIAKILSTWGVIPSKNFRDFLLSGQWKWCICVGHSLGGAMSAISALELSVRTGKPVYAIGIGTAIPGNEAFSEIMDQYVQPKGGLRIANEGDAIAFMGYGVVSFSRTSRIVHGYEWILPHHWGRTYFKRLKNHIQYDILDWNTIPKRFMFPKIGQHYTSNDDQLKDHYAAETILFSERDP